MADDDAAAADRPVTFFARHDGTTRTGPGIAIFARHDSAVTSNCGIPLVALGDCAVTACRGISFLTFHGDTAWANGGRFALFAFHGCGAPSTPDLGGKRSDPDSDGHQKRPRRDRCPSNVFHNRQPSGRSGHTWFIS
jgi:hypothetical protein